MAFAGAAPAASMEKLETNASAIEVRLEMVCNVIPVAFYGQLPVRFTL